MISPTSTPQYFGTTSSSSATTSKKEIDKDAFLKLLVQQLKHQDPLNPMEPEQFASQLAQFSSVEQLTQIKASIDAQTEASNMAALVQQTTLSTALIGREVLASGDQVNVPVSGAAKVTVDISGLGGAGKLTLTNDAGTVIATRDLGQLTPGNGKTVTLPADLPPGTWHYAISVKDSHGDTTTATTYTTGVVSALEFKNGAIVLHVGDAQIALTDIVRVSPASATAATTAAAAPDTYGERPGAESLPPGWTGDAEDTAYGGRSGTGPLPPGGTDPDGLSFVGGAVRLVGGVVRLLPGLLLP